MVDLGKATKAWHRGSAVMAGDSQWLWEQSTCSAKRQQRRLKVNLYGCLTQTGSWPFARVSLPVNSELP